MTSIYTRLEPSRSEIRLLTLYPGESDEAIQCSLHTVSLEDDPQYEALSYVWGDCTNTLPIFVNDDEMQVGQTLEAALTHLRLCDSTRILWVDAICINQQDDPEKSVQVPLMGDLYRKATSVLVWLGHGSEEIEATIHWALDHETREIKDDTPEWPAIDIQVPPENQMVEKFYRLFCTYWSFSKMFQHEYWFRMWTFQEFIMSQKTPICVYGHSSCSMSTLVKAFEYFQAAVDAWESDPIFCGEGYWMYRATWLSSMQKNSDDDLGALLRNMKTRISHAEQPRDLVRLLSGTTGRRYTNPRDRIYALFGFSSAFSERHKVDYSKTEERVILEALEYIMRNPESDLLWRFFEPRPGRLSCKKLPSWCPDLDTHRRIWIMDDHYCGLKFTNMSIGIDRLSSDLTTLHMWSWDLGSCKVIWHLDQVSNHGEKALADNNLLSVEQNTRDLARFITLLKTDESFTEIRGTCPGIFYRFARLAVCMIEGHREISDDDLLEAFELFSAWEDQDSFRNEHGSYVTKALELVSSSTIWLGKRACVVTSHGSIGFAPFDTEDNDTMIQPRRPYPPMVLRKEAVDPSSDDQESYLMVGTAHVNTLGSWGDHVFNSLGTKICDIGVVEYLIH
ncbi:hypothetical protein G7054_g7564 [Neopestalotiopsis clavispora]|nr:hypothetical protein G7054_g7564 [Neopestalotiopsis clavispora]